MRKKSTVKKTRNPAAAVIIREPAPQPEQQDTTESGESEDEDSLYAPGAKPDSEDEPMSEEEYEVNYYPNDTCELIYPRQELVEYPSWIVNLTDELLERMKQFSSVKLQEAFDDKDEGSKQVKCGKVIHTPSLEELAANIPFRTYIREMGFGWLLVNEDHNISVRLANEFFTTFRFRVTTDLDEESISFRVYGHEMRMSITEWSVRLGMCTLREAISPEWRLRERGVPKKHIDFDTQAAWAELTHPHSGEFASTQSRSTHFNNNILRLVQLYLDFNLLGQSNSAVRTSMTELYLLWCAWRSRKVHLGFWTAYQCHQIATHPARNLSLCNILGAFVTLNVRVIVSPDLSPMYMVSPPPPFDLNLFLRTNTIYMRDNVPFFFDMGDGAIPVGIVPQNDVQEQVPDQGNTQERMEVLEERQRRTEAMMTEMVEQNKKTIEQVNNVQQLMERFLRTFEGKESGAGPSAVAPRDEDNDQNEAETNESEEDEEETPEKAPEPIAPRRSRRNLHPTD